MASPTDLTPGTWNIDGTHSSVGFSVRHLMISKVRGSFKTVSGSVTVPEDRLATKLNVSIDMASIDTGDAGRDAHLHGNDFLDVAGFPTMTFASTSIAAKSDAYVLKGDLTIKGVTKPVSLDVEFEGTGTDPWGNTKAGFSASGQINRKDWGIEYNAVLEAGGVMIGEEVKLSLDIQLVKAN
jgi:polyisoprenoid-binding protein YceI